MTSQFSKATQPTFRSYLLGPAALLLSLTLAFAPSATAQDLLAEADTLAGRFDQGRMWTFDLPPAEYFSETYAFDADAAWFAEARMAALRLPNCSAGFVSARGLVLTNHHCIRGYLARVAEPGETLLDDGFYAETLAGERRVPGVYVDQVVGIEDVTLAVDARMEGLGADEAARVAAELAEEMTEALGQEGAEQEGTRVQVVSLYQGARYSAYTFRRYDDVRLVFAPELQLGYYGGDADNYVFPRYALDMGLLRVYDEGEPIRTDHFFSWSLDGIREGDPIFVVGNPGATFRLESVSQLETRRDVTDSALYDWILRYAEATESALGQIAEAERDVYRNRLFGLRNNDKRYGGRLRALRDANVMARRMDGERRLREGLAADGIAPEFAAAFDEMEAVQAQRRELAAPTAAFVRLGTPRYSAALLRRALLAYELSQDGSLADPARAASAERIVSIPDLPPALERAYLAARLETIAEAYGPDAAITQNLLGGLTPEARADALIANSAFTSQASAEAALAGGSVPGADPAIEAVAAFYAAFAEYQAENERLTRDELRLERVIGQARLAVLGPEAPPDGTFSLRIADGVVLGYPYNGTITPPFTTFFGLYDRYFGFQADEPTQPAGIWDLPPRWAEQPEALDLGTPLNFVATANTTGGNSGSPVVNRSLELVGLNFDRNIEGLTADFLFYEEGPLRNVMVDARGMLEALAHVYEADRLVRELAEGDLAD